MDSAIDPPFPPELLAILCCPETRQPLSVAPRELLARLPVPLAAGLVREDGRVVYPIREGIPLLIVDEAITVPDPAAPPA